MDKFILLLILCYTASNTQVYFEIKRNESLNFHLEKPKSSFYAYLTYEEDYENAQNFINMTHYLRLDKKIGFKHLIIDKNGSFPNESTFNRNSEGIVSKHNYTYKSLEPFKNIKLKEYYKFEKGKDTNKKSIFVFYLEEEYKDSYKSNENFTISRIKYGSYNNNIIIDDELENDNIKLYVFDIINDISNNSLLFINFPISTVYEYNSSNYVKINSNINLFQFKNEGNISAILLFVYNPNENQNISIEYRIKDKKEFYRSLDLRTFNNCISYGDYRNLFYVSIEPGLYKVSGEYASEKYIFLFKDNINEIKNLTDLKYLNHYQYGNVGYQYFSENYFIILICSTKHIELNISKIELKENIKNLNIYKFEYF